jgi:hypothetical protein
MRNAQILVGKPDWRRPMYRQEDNIEVGLKEAGYKGVDWINVYKNIIHWRLIVNTEMNILVP